MVCATTIYDFIRQDKISGGDLYKNLRHRKPYKRRAGASESRGQIIRCISIDERPSIVNEKIRIGDWEADIVIDKGRKGVWPDALVKKHSLFMFHLSMQKWLKRDHLTVKARDGVSSHNYV